MLRKILAFVFLSSLAGTAAAGWWFHPSEGVPDLDNRVDALERAFTDPTVLATVAGFSPFAVGSTSRSAAERWGGTVYVEDYLPRNYVTDGSVDYTSEIQTAWSHVPAHGGLHFPVGKFQITSPLVVRSGMRIDGAGSVDFAYGNVVAADALARSTYLFGVNSGGIFYFPGAAPPTGNYDITQVTIENLSLGADLDPTSTSTATVGSYGIRMLGAQPYHVQGVTLRNLHFYNFHYALTVEDNGAGIGWNAEGVHIKNSIWHNNTIAVYMDSTNADDWRFEDCAIYIPAVTGATGIYGRRTGFFTMDNVIGGGSGWSLGDAIFLDVAWDQIQIRASQFENVKNFVHVGPAHAGQQDNTRLSIQMIGSISECANTIERAAKIDSYASRYSHPIAVTAGVGAIISSTNDSFVTPFDPSQVQSVAVGSASCAANDWVTVLATAHGLTEMDRIDASGSSVAAYNVLDTPVIPDNANQFRYLAPGATVGTAVTPPAINKLARWQVNPGDGNTLKAWPPKYRQFPGSPSGAFTPLYLGEDLFDRTNGKWYRATGATATSWAALN